jgi:hypothetical protein
VIVCILFSKKKFFFFLRSFVRLFFILLLFFSRTSYDWTSEIFQHRRISFSCVIYTHTIPTLTSILLPVLFFLLRVVILKEKRIYIYVCVFFFLLLHFFFLVIESKQTNKDCICFMSSFFLSFVTNFKQTRLKTKQ